MEEPGYEAGNPPEDYTQLVGAEASPGWSLYTSASVPFCTACNTFQMEQLPNDLSQMDVKSITKLYPRRINCFSPIFQSQALCMKICKNYFRVTRRLPWNFNGKIFYSWKIRSSGMQCNSGLKTNFNATSLMGLLRDVVITNILHVHVKWSNFWNIYFFMKTPRDHICMGVLF